MKSENLEDNRDIQVKTRKGFSRVDRYEFLRRQICPDCGVTKFQDKTGHPMGFSGWQSIFDRVVRGCPVLSWFSVGAEAFLEMPAAVQRQQVARLVERPIEVVEDHRYTCQCAQCGQRVSAPPDPNVIPGQDLSIGLPALLTWLGNQGHLSYEKQL